MDVYKNAAAQIFSNAFGAADPPADNGIPLSVVISLIAVSSAFSGYHGYKRNNNSLGWGLGWAFLSGGMWALAPVVIAISPTYDKKDLFPPSPYFEVSLGLLGGGLIGAMATPVIAIAEGYGKPAKKK